jgi:hypothetical protein
VPWQERYSGSMPTPRPEGIHALVALGACALALALAACDEPAVRWGEAAAAPTPPKPEMRLVLDGRGGLRWVEPDATPRRPPVAAASACPGSMRVARAGAWTVYAVWWAPRADSSAALVAARSRDGGESWPDVAPVDTADRGASGCRRPAADVAADAVNGYVHVAYSLVAPGAPGVFFAHSMPDHFMFHAPVTVIYGERPVPVSVAASGNLVVVAYEDPNAAEPRVGLAISRTLGHTFEQRVAASTGPGAAVDPRVAVAGRRVAVAWRRGDVGRGLDGDVGVAAGPIIARVGELAGP